MSENSTYDALVCDLDDAFDTLAECITQLKASGHDKDPRKRILSNGHTALDNGEELLEQLELELKHVAKEGKGAKTKQLREYQNKLDKMERDLNRAANSQQGGDVYHGGYGYHSEDEDDAGPLVDDPNRNRLLVAQEAIERTNQRLQNSERMARETEDYGGAVLGELHDQRETILRVGDVLDDTSSNLYRSDRTLRGMLRRAWVNHMMYYIIIAVILLIVFIILYLKLS